jgi:hypothetical protein
MNKCVVCENSITEWFPTSYGNSCIKCYYLYLPWSLEHIPQEAIKIARERRNNKNDTIQT